ncbi:helix-turn-helix domain-containing protein [Candidatus Woesearchaeota archaeon]|nr:helix-turn-helix domain-containing protein [Candidatus Woesearchaeota archaeon]
MYKEILLTEKSENLNVTRRYNVILEEIIKARFKTKAKFAEILGVGRSLISQFVHGHKEPSREMKIQLAKKLGEDSRLFWK